MSASSAFEYRGDTVAVFGCGPVGQFAIASAKLLGAGRVFAIDRHDDRLRMAQRQGAEAINFDREDPVETLKRLTGGIGVDRVIDAVGVDAEHGCCGAAATSSSAQGQLWQPGDAPSQALEWAVQSIAKAGTLSIIGVYPPDAMTFPIGMAMNKNITINMGNCHHRKYIPLLLEHVLSGRIDPAKILTQVKPMTDVIAGVVGIGKDGEPTENFQLGMELHAKYTLFAEGSRGHLGRQLIARYKLDAGKDPQSFGLGVKELWEIDPARHQPGLQRRPVQRPGRGAADPGDVDLVPLKQPVEHAPAVEVGHRQIEQHDIGPVVARGAHGLLAVGGLPDHLDGRVLVELGPHPGAGAVCDLPHRRRLPFQHLCDLGVLVAEHLTQQEDRAFHRAQFVEHDEHRQRHRVGEDDVVGDIAAGEYWLG